MAGRVPCANAMEVMPTIEPVIANRTIRFIFGASTRSNKDRDAEYGCALLTGQWHPDYACVSAALDCAAAFLLRTRPYRGTE